MDADDPYLPEASPFIPPSVQSYAAIYDVAPDTARLEEAARLEDRPDGICDQPVEVTPPAKPTPASEPVSEAQPASETVPAPAPGPVPAPVPERTPVGEAQPVSEPGPKPVGDPRPTSRTRIPALIGLAAVAALIGAAAGAGTVAFADHRESRPRIQFGVTGEVGAPRVSLSGSIEAAAAKIAPSVVSVSVVGRGSAGTGTGVIIAAAGFILTDDHLVAGATSAGAGIIVMLADGRASAARVVGRDSPDDLAVLKVPFTGLSAATFANSEQVSVGQPVIAVGVPPGLTDTITSGILSSTGRAVHPGTGSQTVFEALQTDAALSPVNSGGPLVDLNGSVVGINNALSTDSSSAGQARTTGLGFAIGANQASRIAAQLVSLGRVTHAILGLSIAADDAPAAQGVLVHAVTKGGPAARAGLRLGDLISSLGAHRVTTPDELIAAIRSHAPGQSVTVQYLRRGNAMTVTVILGGSDG